MDDIDRTYNRLRRIDFDVLMDILREESGHTGHFIIINPITFEPKLSLAYYETCIKHGWTVQDFNDKLIYPIT